jgi:hypothetical protein
MWTLKNILALGLFLFGTTFLWMTASFAGRAPPPTGTAWTFVNGLALAAVAGFTVAGWAVFKTYSWWPTVAAPPGQRRGRRDDAGAGGPRLGGAPAVTGAS